MFEDSAACSPGNKACYPRLVTTVLHELAESLGAAVDAKDPHTWQHSAEVAVVAHALALEMGVPYHRASIIHVAAHLHDVGKIGVPDSILRKAGPLSDTEWEMLRMHPAIGAGIIRPVKALRDCGILEMVLHHHERYDGCGYPDGLSREDIPLGARIIAVSDSFSAMLQSRPYRAALDLTTAFKEIRDNAGTQFDPAVVRAFCAIHDKLYELLQAVRGQDAHAPARHEEIIQA